MSGFSDEWLALREPADLRALNVRVRDLVVERLRGVENPHIVDLGCGAGSNARALAPHLGRRQRWTLVDHDDALLAAARARLAAWGDGVSSRDDRLVVEKGERVIEFAFRRLDLRAELDTALAVSADLVTAAAFFDLVGAPWAERFATGVTRLGAAVLATLVYDGVERWRPPHPADAAALAAFHAHQRGDKGLGPALGPAATDVLRDLLERRFWRVETGDSAWRLDEGDRDLIARLAEGSAAAIRETGLLPEATLESWRLARIHAETCEIGHMDLFAAPP